MDLQLPLTLRSSRRKSLALLLLCLLFVVGGVLMIRSGDSSGWFCGGFFAIGLPVFGVQLHPKAAWLRLTTEGFTLCTLFRAHTVRWSDVHATGELDDAGENVPGALQAFRVVRTGLHQMVGWNYAAGYERSAAMRSLSHALSGCEAALPETYGLKAQELADLMNRLLAQCIGVSPKEDREAYLK